MYFDGFFQTILLEKHLGKLGLNPSTEIKNKKIYDPKLKQLITTSNSRNSFSMTLVNKMNELVVNKIKTKHFDQVIIR